MSEAAVPGKMARWQGVVLSVVVYTVLTGLMWDLINPVAAIGVGAAGVVQVTFLLVRAIRHTPPGPGLPKNPN
ncbi:MAG: hypothetical protein ACR2LI_14905 [Propionibacteriaceae bacterium]